MHFHARRFKFARSAHEARLFQRLSGIWVGFDWMAGRFLVFQVHCEDLASILNRATQVLIYVLLQMYLCATVKGPRLRNISFCTDED